MGQALGSPAVMVDPTLDCDLKVYISDIEMYSYKNAEPGSVIEILNDELLVASNDVASNLNHIVSYFIHNRFIEKYNLQYSSNIVAG